MMRRRHLTAFDGEQQTLCGHSATIQEFRRMRSFNPKDVTCKRCLKLKEKLTKQNFYFNTKKNQQKPVKITASI